MRRLCALVLAIGLVAATPAAADQLAFDCGRAFENLCRARPDGSGLQQLTTDGDASGTTNRVYSAPALTRDGRRLAYVFGGDVFIRDLVSGATQHATAQFLPTLLRFRGDGARFAVAELTAAGAPDTQVCAYNSDLSGSNEGRYCVAGGVSSAMDYLPDGRLVMAASGGTMTGGRTVIMLLRPEDGGPTGSERTLVDDPRFDLESPAVSPDGRLAAVVQASPNGGTAGDIAIYDLATGALIRELTTAGGAAAPVFSNDGGTVAFDRAGGIWVTPVTGPPGSERRIVAHGRSASWGGGSIPRAFSALRIARRQRGDTVRGRLRIARAGSRLSVELRAAGRRIGRRSRRSLPAGKVRFAVRARGSARRIEVRVAVTPPGGVADRATRRVTLRRAR
jgi:Tol biopolymer transport system component